MAFQSGSGRAAAAPCLINVKFTKEGATPDQKAEPIRRVTQDLAKVLGKNPQAIIVVIDEIESDNWGIAGETVAVRRKRGQ